MSAPRAAASPLPVRARGITLIELLVVIAILAVIAVVALLSTDLAGAGRRAQREAERLAVVMALACERAELSGSEYGLHFADDAYAFSRHNREGWTIERDGVLAQHELPRGFRLLVERDGESLTTTRTVSEEPMTACFPSGEIAPFRATLMLGAVATWRITGDVDGKVEAKEVAAP